jgi:hypothetical protein
MKPRLFRVRPLCSAGLLLCALSSAVAQTAEQAAPEAVLKEAPRIGTFKQVQGETWVGTDTARRAAQPGAGVALTDRLSTGPKAAATLTLKDGTVLTMGPDTVMDLHQFQFDTTTQQGNFLLDLLRGSVRVVTGLLAKVNPERFQVQTPTSVVGVRGTDFIVDTQAER